MRFCQLPAPVVSSSRRAEGVHNQLYHTLTPRSQCSGAQESGTPASVSERSAERQSPRSNLQKSSRYSSINLYRSAAINRQTTRIMAVRNGHHPRHLPVRRTGKEARHARVHVLVHLIRRTPVQGVQLRAAASVNSGVNSASGFRSSAANTRRRLSLPVQNMTSDNGPQQLVVAALPPEMLLHGTCVVTPSISSMALKTAVDR